MVGAISAIGESNKLKSQPHPQPLPVREGSKKPSLASLPNGEGLG
jgi:hypothetical protein